MVRTLQINARTDGDGHLRLDMPIAHSSVDLSLIIVMNSLAPGKGQYDCSDLAGRLKWRGDAVKEQRALREQWT